MFSLRESPLAVLEKSDRNLHICRDYKISINCKICSDSSPILKLIFKTDYYQIQIDDNFKKITTINSHIGLLRW